MECEMWWNCTQCDLKQVRDSESPQNKGANTGRQEGKKERKEKNGKQIMNFWILQMKQLQLSIQIILISSNISKPYKARNF